MGPSQLAKVSNRDADRDHSKRRLGILHSVDLELSPISESSTNSISSYDASHPAIVVST